MREEEAIVFGVFFAIVGIVLLVMFAIQVFICWYTSSCLQRIPERYREQSPGMVWLLLIPCFNLIWNFFVYPKVAASFQNYFNDQESVQGDIGDCGASLAQYYCIAFICQIVPLVNYLAGPASLVLLILTLVKFSSLKAMIPEGAASGDYYG
ncbi:MAG: hypothetical protein R3F62_27080 [Planctomycetota bacterium]